MNPKVPLLLTSPHAGEQVPDEAHWLKNLDRRVLLCDSDLYVTELYKEVSKKHGLVLIENPWVRYAGDLNRFEDEIGPKTVLGSVLRDDSMSRGLYWQTTSQGDVLLSAPLSQEVHQALLDKLYRPFHNNLTQSFEYLKALGLKKVYHFDLHSMPSKGSKMHRDRGEVRADIVVSDQDGSSCEPYIFNLVVEAFESEGFKVAKNWPYKGGRITQIYGRPDKGQHTLQIELNRGLYMDEVTKLKAPHFADFKLRLEAVVSHIFKELGYGIHNK